MPTPSSARDECECLQRGPRFPDARSSPIGVDPSNGRFADVAAIECLNCGRLWLKYGWELEWHSRSGRWYAGLVSPDQVERLVPEDAPQVLEGLDWYLAGGSYFDGKISRVSGSFPAS
jgi:hypothetical protein